MNFMESAKEFFKDHKTGLFRIETFEPGTPGTHVRYLNEAEFSALCNGKSIEEVAGMAQIRRERNVALDRIINASNSEEHDMAYAEAWALSKYLTRDKCNGFITIIKGKDINIQPAYISAAQEIFMDHKSEKSLAHYVWCPDYVMREEIRFGGPSDKIHWDFINHSELGKISALRGKRSEQIGFFLNKAHLAQALAIYVSKQLAAFEQKKKAIDVEMSELNDAFKAKLKELA